MVAPSTPMVSVTVSLLLIFIAVFTVSNFRAARPPTHAGSYFGLCAPRTAAPSSSTPYSPPVSLYSQPREPTSAARCPVPTGGWSLGRSPSGGRPSRGGGGGSHTRPPSEPATPPGPRLSSSSSSLCYSPSSSSNTASVTVFVGEAGGGESGVVFGKGDRDARNGRRTGSGGGGGPGRLQSFKSLRVLAALAAPLAASCRRPSKSNKIKTKKGCEGPELRPFACVVLASALLGYGKQLFAASTHLTNSGGGGGVGGRSVVVY